MTATADAPSGEPRSGRGGTFEALRIPAYRRLFASGVFIFLAVQAQQVVRGWLAAELTGSNRGLGGVFFGFAIPMLLVTPFGGVAADRMPKRTVLLVSNVLLLGSALWIGVADLFGVLEYWMLIGAAAVQATGFSLFGPTRIAFTSDLVDRETLPNAVLLSQVSLNSTRIIGPAAGGALIGIEAIGTAWTYMGTAALMGVSLLIVATLPRGESRRTGPSRTPIAEFREGLAYVRANRPVRLLIIASYAVVMFAFPYIAFLPLVATDLFEVGSTGFGLMSAATGVAAVTVSLRIAGLANADTWRIQAVAGTTFGVGLILLAFAPIFPLALVALLVIGGSASAFQAMNNTLILTETELEYHGRVQSLLMLSFSGFGLAALPLGTLADAVGLRPTIAGMGVAAVVSMLLYRRARSRMLQAARPMPLL